MPALDYNMHFHIILQHECTLTAMDFVAFSSPFVVHTEIVPS